MTISKRDAETLRRARRLQIELRELRKELSEQRAVAIRSPSMDGMPGRKADADRMTARLIRIEQMERRARSLSRAACDAQAEARLVCRRMTDRKLRLFLEAYYAEAQTLDAAILVAGIAQRRTAHRYMALVGDAPDGEER